MLDGVSQSIAIFDLLATVHSFVTSVPWRSVMWMRVVLASMISGEIRLIFFVIICHIYERVRFSLTTVFNRQPG
jgi:hypothetical protein